MLIMLRIDCGFIFISREIMTVLEIPANILSDAKGSLEPGCRVLFREMIPSSAFVDPFQLASLKDFGGPDVSTSPVKPIKIGYLGQTFLIFRFTGILKKVCSRRRK